MSAYDAATWVVNNREKYYLINVLQKACFLDICSTVLHVAILQQHGRACKVVLAILR